MSNYERNAYSPFGGVARAGTAEYDMGLRAYMLGIYNYMSIASAIYVEQIIELGATYGSITTVVGFSNVENLTGGSLSDDFRFSTFGSGIGTAESSACVYGCMGMLKSSRPSASSTILPRYITATRSQIWRTMLRSWAMNR